MAQPRFPDDPAFRLLRTGEVEDFNRQIAGQKEVDYSHADLRGVDFRGVDLTKIVVRGSYLRDADLRGLDLRHLDLEGCSLYHAKISGTYFPTNVTAEEILASVHYGIRLRTSR